jgi:hypothetical protein
LGSTPFGLHFFVLKKVLYYSHNLTLTRPR